MTDVVAAHRDRLDVLRLPVTGQLASDDFNFYHVQHKAVPRASGEFGEGDLLVHSPAGPDPDHPAPGTRSGPQSGTVCRSLEMSAPRPEPNPGLLPFCRHRSLRGPRTRFLDDPNPVGALKVKTGLPRR